MKRILLSCLLLLSIHTLKAQDTRLNNVVNTLKERITLAGYAQVGYTYDDAGEKASNTFDLKRAIFMARARLPINGRATSCTASPIPERYWKLIRNTGSCPNSLPASDSSKQCTPLRIRCLPVLSTDKLLFTGGQLSGRYQRQRSTLRLEQRP